MIRHLAKTPRPITIGPTSLRRLFGPVFPDGRSGVVGELLAGLLVEDLDVAAVELFADDDHDVFSELHGKLTFPAIAAKMPICQPRSPESLSCF